MNATTSTQDTATQDAPTVEQALKSLLAWMVEAEEELGAPLALGYRAKVQKPVVIARARDALKAENAALQATSTAKRGSPFIRQLKDENARLKEALAAAEHTIATTMAVIELNLGTNPEATP